MDEPVQRRGGRPRDPGADEAIIAAVFDVLGECGFAGFSVEAVAARAGVGKATIYRRWATKEELMVAAAERMVAIEALPDTGCLRDDLVEWFWEHVRAKKALSDERRYGLLLVEATSNPDLMKLVRGFRKGRRDALGTLCERDANRTDGEPIDAHLLGDLVFGAILQRSMFGDQRIDRVDIERYVDTVMVGLSTHPRTATRHRIERGVGQSMS